MKLKFLNIQDDEKNSIRILINSAILDPEVKGGLRWPMGKSYSKDYRIVGVWHNEFKSYKSPSLKLETGPGEATIEINLKLRRLVSEIQDGKIATDSIYSGFKDNLRELESLGDPLVKVEKTVVQLWHGTTVAL
ncbi:hypothetical protein CUMW_276740 [Citrus unshiu]|uniref:DUF7903 domain-containing protein n=1 Tax=Citrus unshiu TaxID=55188 RepID=A0A2H5N2D9_CITUN|nr:hypothetical protein CUMW_276740 [Citrus unshiu]